MSQFVGVKVRGSLRNSQAIDALCPVKWTVNMDSRRRPRTMMEAECNEQSGHCLTSDNQPACTELKREVEVYILLGKDQKTGKIVYRREKRLIPVACSCSLL